MKSDALTRRQKWGFVDYIFENYDIENQLSERFLRNLTSEDWMLKRVHFVESGVSYCPVGVQIILDRRVKGHRFSIWIDGDRKLGPGRYDLLMNEIFDEKEIYLNIILPRKDIKAVEKQYLILEDNPYIPENLRPEMAHSELVGNLLKAVELKNSIKVKLNEIDEALDKGNKVRFGELSSEYSQLLSQLNTLNRQATS